MEPRKQAIMAALDKFVAQRPGLEFGNYGDVKAYRAEMRSITRDRHDYNTLARAVERSDSITADMLIEASRHAYGGRLTGTLKPHPGLQGLDGLPRVPRCEITYVTGQYFPTEYRKAAAAVLAAALWAHVRENCMPTPTLHHNSETGETLHRYNGLRAGDWLRAYFRREFGRSIANRWFR